MNKREHARLARELIEKCGGLAEASNACRVGKSVLSSYQTPDARCFTSMPADVLADLEQYCGSPIYSAALFNRFDPPSAVVEDIGEAACDLSEAAVLMQGVARRIKSHDRPTQRELHELAEDERAAEQALEHFRAARIAAENAIGKAGLRAV